MDFSWSDEEQQLYERTLAFFSHLKVVTDKPLVSRTSDVWRAMGEFGVLGVAVDASHGGLGLTPLQTVHMTEAIGLGINNFGLAFAALAHAFACVEPIAKFCTPEIRETWLPRLLSGDAVGANAITEAEAGSDAFALHTEAVRDGSDYVISGVKSYVSNGPASDILLVYASTNKNAGLLGVSAFVIPTNMKGVTLGKPFDGMGLDCAPIGPVYFDACRIPGSSLLGHEGSGAQIFRHSMQWERTGLFGAYVGLAQRMLERSIVYAKERIQGDVAIGKHQAISHRIANMQTRIESARCLLYRAAWSITHEDRNRSEMLVSSAKLHVSEMAVSTAMDAIAIHGGMGCMRDVGIECALRDSIPSTIFSGTSDIQRNAIAAHLGL